MVTARTGIGVLARVGMAIPRISFCFLERPELIWVFEFPLKFIPRRLHVVSACPPASFMFKIMGRRLGKGPFVILLRVAKISVSSRLPHTLGMHIARVVDSRTDGGEA